MLDIKFILLNREKVKTNCKNKNCDDKFVDISINLYKQKNDLIAKIDQLRQERNKLTKNNVNRGREIRNNLKLLEKDLKEIKIAYRKAMFEIPNMASDDVPLGKNDKENIIIKRWFPKSKDLPMGTITWLTAMVMEKKMTIKEAEIYWKKGQEGTFKS